MSIQIGVETADITPDGPITGRIGVDHTISAEHPIHAKAIFFNCDEPVVQITCEIVGLPRVFAAKIRAAVSRGLGIPGNNVILTSTHSHCSPWVWEAQDRSARAHGMAIMDYSWEKKVVTGCVSAARGAAAHADVSTMYLGTADVLDVASNRTQHGSRWSITSDAELRARPVGDIDPEVRILAVCGPDDETPKALLANYSCHPSAYGGGQTPFISPDFPYHAERFLNEHFGGPIPLFYWMGCAGNINAGKFVAEGSHAEVEGLGRRFADGVIAAWEKRTPVSGDIRLSWRDGRYSLGTWVESEPEAKAAFDTATSSLLDAKKRHGAVDPETVGNWRMAVKRLDVCRLAEDRQMAVRVWKISLGEVQLLFVPGEWFHSYGLSVSKERPKGTTWITTLADFDLLYIPDEKSMPHKDWYGVSPRMRTIGDTEALRLFNDTRAMISKR